MTKKLDNRGVSLLELIVAISVMVIWVGVVTLSMIKYVSKARQVKVEKEASEFIEAARIAYIDVYSEGKEPLADAIKHKAAQSSPYYRGGTRYVNLTNWTVHNGTVAGASNGAFADEFFGILGITYGAGWKSGSSSVPISTSQPKLNPAGSTTKECIFQVFYNEAGDMVVEYSRYGYFVRMENSVVVDSIRITNQSAKYFTVWQ